MVGLKDIYDQVILMANQQAMFTGKLDGFISTWNSQVDIISREIKRIETDAQRALADHETRIRDLKTALSEVQARPVVTPKAVWGAVGAFTGIISVAVAIIVALTR